MRTLRGPSETRSLSGTRAGSGGAVARPKERHVLQFKIGCLELERSRRATEKAVALERIRGIDARLAAIDAEIGKHHGDLGYAVSLAHDPGTGVIEDRVQGAGQPRRMIRYGG